MLAYRDVINGIKCLDLEQNTPAIVHASLSSFGEVRGGADTILGALLTSMNSVMTPTFTYKTMLIPEDGPEDNGLNYGTGKDTNRMSEFYDPTMPADPMMGVIAEKLRQVPGARRSSHPILSFSGVGVDQAIKAQTLEEPLAPIGELLARDGWVLLLGVDQTVNTSIHYAERLAGRKQFMRWALSTEGVTACPGFPGCSDGFNQIDPQLARVTRVVKIGGARIQAIPLKELMHAVQQTLAKDPLALLCSRSDCERCNTVRKSVRSASN